MTSLKKIFKSLCCTSNTTTDKPEKRLNPGRLGARVVTLPNASLQRTLASRDERFAAPLSFYLHANDGDIAAKVIRECKGMSAAQKQTQLLIERRIAKEVKTAAGLL